MNSISIAQNSGRIDIQEATLNFNLAMISAVEVDLPSKHLRFHSFQIEQITTVKEDLHKSFPVLEDKSKQQIAPSLTLI